MKALIVDDDFSCRKILFKYLSAYGDCDVATNGNEAVEAFRQSMEDGECYDLVCLDIMMPEMDGQDVLKQIRQIEKEKGKLGLDGTKVIMTTALDDVINVKMAFREQCESYLVKPIDREKLIKDLKDFGLI